ncbi:MAG: phosphoethanolamine--lipid A transferase [Acinetobacter sp.]|nr:phosphoethanolamine--lipid A transferase [Acinetobacter sp.]
MQNLKAKLSQLRNKIKPISLGVFNLFIALWLGIILNIGFYEKVNELTPYQGLKAIIFITATVCIVVAFYNLVMQLFAWKWTAKVCAIILIVIGGFSSYFVNSLGIVITSDQVQNMMQTDIKEVNDLLSPQLLTWMFGAIVLPIFAILLVRLKGETVLKTLLKKTVYSIASLAIIGGLLFSFYIDFAAIFREHRDLKGMISPQNAIASTTSYFHKKAPKKNLPLLTYGDDAHFVEKVGSLNTPKLMVLVVGETARAESFSLNGYSKNTNPKLSKQDIINFSQVSSCGTATAVSVPCMFSGMPRDAYDEELASHREGLLDIAKKAGYKVTWIDNNSGCKGACDRVEEYEIPKELKQKWCDNSGECLDGILVDSLKLYLSKIPEEDKVQRLIVLHQMGSHGPAYFKRSTDEFKNFKPTCDTNAIQGCSQGALINSYDNTILYTDHVLSELIDTLKQDTKYQTGFWYLSDHGESTGEKGLYLHGAPYAIAPSQQTHVPMLMWFSPQWKQSISHELDCLNQRKNQQFSQDNLFPSMLSLLGINTKVLDSKLNMFNQCNAKTRA